VFIGRHSLAQVKPLEQRERMVARNGTAHAE